MPRWVFCKKCYRPLCEAALHATTGCRCSEGFNTSVASDPYNVTCIPLLNQRPSQPSETGAPGTAAPGSITIVNNYITVIVFIFQFQAPYQLSEVTDQVKNKMTEAVAEILGVNTSDVILSFVAVGTRRRGLLQQSGGVLVSVSLKNLQGSGNIFASR